MTSFAGQASNIAGSSAKMQEGESAAGNESGSDSDSESCPVTSQAHFPARDALVFVRKSAKPHQEVAINEVVNKVVVDGERGTMLVGGTGSGKTLCGLEIMSRIAKRLGASGESNGFTVIVIVPPMGDTVQTVHERMAWTRT